MGGNRSILVDHDLSGVIVGLTLATRPEEIYRALLEATAFGTRVIVEAFEAGGRSGHRVRGRRRLEAQQLPDADLCRHPAPAGVRRGSEQAPALGSAIHAAVAAGAYPDVPTAAEAMGSCEVAAYVPDPARADAYDVLFAEYRALHDLFGFDDHQHSVGSGGALHRLRRIRNAALASETGAQEKEAAQ